MSSPFFIRQHRANAAITRRPKRHTRGGSLARTDRHLRFPKGTPAADTVRAAGGFSARGSAPVVYISKRAREGVMEACIAVRMQLCHAPL
jgi:hypothetical protein